MCNGITNETLTGPQSPRPVQAWDAGTEHFIACLIDIAAKQPIESEAVFDKPIDQSSFVFDPVLGVFVRNVEYGPFSVAFNP